MRLHGKTAPARRLIAALLLVTCAAVAAPAARAQLIYPHSPAEEKAANEIREGLDGAKKAHLDAIDKHKTYLEESGKEERRLVAERELAYRDRVLVTALDVHSRSAVNGRKELNARVLKRIADVTGLQSADGSTVPNFATIEAAALGISDRRGNIARDRARLARYVAQFEGAGGEGTYCDDDGAGVASAPTQGGRQAHIFDAIRLTCGTIKSEVDSLKTLYANLDPAVAALLGDATRSPTLPTLSPLRDALEDAEATKNLLRAQKALAGAAKQRLKELKKHHECEVARGAGGNNEDRIGAAAGAFGSFVDWLSGQGDSWLAAGTAKPALAAPPEVEGDAECPVSRWPEEGLIGAAGLRSASVASWVLTAREIDPLRSLVADAQEEAHRFKGSEASTFIAALSDPAATADDRAKAATAGSLLKIVGHAERLKAARTGTAPRTSKALVELAAAQMRETTARIESARLEKVAALAQARVAALGREGVLLAAANRELTRADPRFDHALLKFADSWNSGRLPDAVLQHDMVNAAYLTWADRERAVIESSYAVLEPAAAQIQTYGAGGLKAGDIASFLQALGLGAIAEGN